MAGFVLECNLPDEWIGVGCVMLFTGVFKASTLLGESFIRHEIFRSAQKLIDKINSYAYLDVISQFKKEYPVSLH